MTHRELCLLAVRWLRRPDSKNGPGCSFAIHEIRTGFSGECPDAIGWRPQDADPECHVVEVKTSRSDFIADTRKPHRAAGQGLGNYRYYMVPQGLVRLDELPAGWGLLEVTARKSIIVRAGGVSPTTDFRERNAARAAFRLESDRDREVAALALLLARTKDASKHLNEQREAAAIRNRMANQIDRLRRSERNLMARLTAAESALDECQCPEVKAARERNSALVGGIR